MPFDKSVGQIHRQAGLLYTAMLSFSAYA